MLKALNKDQVQFIALHAKAAREARDTLLNNVAEDDLAETKAARGEHNPTAELGIEIVPDDPSVPALRELIARLTPDQRAELYALMRIGQGDLAARNWHSGLAQSASLGAETVTASIIEDPDLHDHLTKGLFEATIRT